MTVAAGYAPAEYAGDGLAHTFPFAWPLLAADHLVVELTAGGVTTPLVRGVDYLLNWIGAGATGSVRLVYYDAGTPVNKPPAFGETVTVSRAVPIAQETNLRRGHAMKPEVVERALDRLTMIDQQAERDLDEHAADHLPGGSRAIAWGRILGRGSLIGRPAASPAYADCYFYVEEERTLYQCNHAGTEWVAMQLGADWIPWHTITADTIAIPGHGYKIDASANPVTLTMPADPAADVRVPVLVLNADHDVTVAHNGTKLLGVLQDLTLERAGDGADLLYTGPLLGWSPSSELSGGGAGGLIGGGVKTASFDAVAGYRYIIDASGGPVDVRMPVGPAVNDQVGLLVADATNDIYVRRNGSRLMGGTADLSLERAGDGADLLYTGADFGWSPASELSTAVPRTAADLSFAPTATIAATTTQAAIVEVASDAAAATAGVAAAVVAEAGTRAAADAAIAAEAEEMALVYALVLS